jgi:hypothetical protein
MQGLYHIFLKVGQGKVSHNKMNKIVPWLEARLSRGNFADLPDLKVHCLRNILGVVCTLAVGSFSRNKDLK